MSSERRTYRVIVTRRGASEALLATGGSGLALPSLDVECGARLAPQFQAAMRHRYSLDAYCLWFAKFARPAYAVMEALEKNASAPGSTLWLEREQALSAELGENDRTVLDRFMQSMGEPNGPFASPGWMDELFGWVEQQTRESIRSFEQLNASPNFSLLRIKTSGPTVWFKATGKPNNHELPVSLALARMFPRYVPRILGLHREWNGWLSEDVPGPPLDQARDLHGWERVARDLAELEIASIARSDDLMGAGATDVRIETITDDIDSFLKHIGEIMQAQEKTTPEPLKPSELDALAEGLKEALETLADGRFPATLGHLDFNPCNILVPGDRAVFLDWAEAAVTHPFVTFEYLREQLARSSFASPEANGRLTSAYLHPWSLLYPERELRKALALSPLVAVFAYAVAGDQWRSGQLLDNPSLARQYRSLTRRMYREAAKLPGRERCTG